jgi:hypothetical protein
VKQSDHGYSRETLAAIGDLVMRLRPVGGILGWDAAGKPKAYYRQGASGKLFEMRADCAPDSLPEEVRAILAHESVPRTPEQVVCDMVDVMRCAMQDSKAPPVPGSIIDDLGRAIDDLARPLP